MTHYPKTARSPSYIQMKSFCFEFGSCAIVQKFTTAITMLMGEMLWGIKETTITLLFNFKKIDSRIKQHWSQ